MKHSLILASVAALIGTAVAGAQLAACSSSSSPSAGEDAGPDASENDSSQSPDVTTKKDGGGKEGGPLEDSAGGEDVTSTADGADGETIGLDGGDGATVTPTDGGKDAAGDAEITDSGQDAAVEAGCAAGNVELTVYNYRTWCSLTVAGTQVAAVDGGPPATTQAAVCVAPNASLSASALNSKFELGTPPSPFISGTTTVTDDAGEAFTTVSPDAGSTACVFVCCPFSGTGIDAGPDAGTGCSGITNSCTDAATP